MMAKKRAAKAQDDASRDPAISREITPDLSYIIEPLRGLAVPIAELVLDPRNARKHDERDLTAVAASLRQYKIRKPVVVQLTDDGRKIVRAGNGTVQAAKSNGWTHVPAVLIHEDEQSATGFAITDNRTAELSEWDDERLRELLVEVRVDGLDEQLNEMFADLDAEIANALEPAVSSSGGSASGRSMQPTVEDEIPANPKKPRSRAGDLWLLGKHRLICADCRQSENFERLLSSDRINLAFTSPPYASQRKYDEASGFNPLPPDNYVEWWEPVQATIAARLVENGSLFVNIKPCADGLDTHLYVFDLVIAHVRRWGWHFATEFCWERNGVPKSVTRRFKNQFEPIYQFVRGEWKIRPEAVRHPSACVPTSLGPGSGNTSWAARQGESGVIPNNRRPKKRKHGGSGGWGGKSAEEAQGTSWQPGEAIAEGLAYPGNRLPTFVSSHQATGHPAAFPVGLAAWFIQAFSDAGDVVCDPFSGSGSTLIAAEQLGRSFRGSEISPIYCDIIVARWEKLTGKKAECIAPGVEIPAVA